MNRGSGLIALNIQFPVALIDELSERAFEEGTSRNKLIISILQEDMEKFKDIGQLL